MLIEFHLLQNHAPSNLNRDDTGSPKDCFFGGVKRARISSQCLKRSIRRSPIFQEAMQGHLATRTRRLPELVRDRLLKKGLSQDLAEAAAQKATGFGNKEGTEQAKLETAQTMFLTDSDIAAITDCLYTAAGKAGSAEAIKKLKAADLQKEAEQKGFRPTSVDVALFGRMTTSVALRDVEGCTQVAHALSTHRLDREYDYFTAVDDLMRTTEEVEEDAGADMIGDVEFNSACYYKYLSVDVGGLVDNLTGASIGRTGITDDETSAARDLAGRAIEAMLQAAILTTPTGKQNSFAAHQLPALVLVEARPHATPVSYANAFVEPARAGKGEDLIGNSLRKLGGHVEALTAGFNLEANPRLLLAPEQSDFAIDGVERIKDLKTLSERIREVVLHG